MEEIIKYEDGAVDVISRYADNLSIEQLRALPLVAYGMTYYKISESLMIPYQTVMTWMRTNSTFRLAVQELRNKATEYHKEMLNQTATLAWDRIYEYLGREFDTTDKDNRVIQARLAQFVISELGLKETKIKVEEPAQVLRVEENSMDILARKIAALNNPVDAQYQISGPTTNEDTRYNSMKTAVLVDGKDNIIADELEETATYQYGHHKDTTYGQITMSGKKFICHVCGDKTLDLVVHIRTAHNLNGARYRAMYGLSSDIKLYTEPLKEEVDAELPEN